MVTNINLGYPQQTFDFDPSYELDLTKAARAVDSLIAENDHVMLDRVFDHFSRQPDEWPETYIIELLNNLFQEDRILFNIDGKKILSGDVKIHFSNTYQSKVDFFKARENLSVLKTHFSDPTRWKYVEIIKPETVQESDLLQARQLGEKLFGSVGVADQNGLCRYLRKHLRMWGNDLEMFQKVAAKGRYPGTDEIRDGLELTGKLLAIYDPYEFISTFINYEDALSRAADEFAVLSNFYKNQIYIWDYSVKVVEDFKPNRRELEKDPDVKKALEALGSILSDPKPYGMIKEVRNLISIIKPVNDRIVEAQLASAKALALEKMEKMIDAVMKVLDEKSETSDNRNKALFPLQTIRKKINSASSLSGLADYRLEAAEEFEYALERLD